MPNTARRAPTPELGKRLSGFLYLRVGLEFGGGKESVPERLGDLEPTIVSRGYDARARLPRFVWRSDHAFFFEDLLGFEGPFEYPILVWEHPWGVLFLGQKKTIMNAFERTVVKRSLRRGLSPTSVDVHAILVHALDDDAVRVSYANLKPKSEGSAVGSVSYYGSDLERSRRFTAEIRADSVRAQTLTLETREPTGWLVTLGADGSISFPRDAIDDVSVALTVYAKQGWFAAQQHRRVMLELPGFENL
jgi:hypothetical protein